MTPDVPAGSVGSNGPTRDRTTSIGASDAAAVLGLDPWRTPADVWLEKTGRLGPIVTPSPAMEAGTFIEPALLAWASAKLGARLLDTQVHLAHPAHPELSATFDGVLADGSLVEAKTSGLVGGGGPHLDAWGDADTDDVPLHVLVQVHHQFAVARAVAASNPLAWPGPPGGPERCYVPALLARRGLVLFRVDASPAIAPAIVRAERSWWHTYVAGDVAPPASVPTLDVLARVTRTTGTEVALPEDAVAAWLDARAAVSTAKDAEEDARRVVLAHLGTGDAGRCAFGVLTYRECHRRAYEVAATTYRRLAWSAAKSRA